MCVIVKRSSACNPIECNICNFLTQIRIQFAAACLTNLFIESITRPIDWGSFANYLPTLICPFGFALQHCHIVWSQTELKLMKQCFWSSAAYFVASTKVQCPEWLHFLRHVAFVSRKAHTHTHTHIHFTERRQLAVLGVRSGRVLGGTECLGRHIRIW